MKKLSFGALLRNDRLMMILSLLAGIGLWYFVMSGSSNITTRTITCNLTTANVSNGALQVIEEKSVTVEVEVEGAWTDINELTADDIRVQLNAADIQNPGSNRVRIQVGRNSQASDYEIRRISPATVSLFCDEWVESRLFEMETGGVTAEAPHITAEGDSRDIAKVALDPRSLPGGVLSVQGPRTVVSKIVQFSARVEETLAITEQQTFAAGLVALDAAGNEVDLTYCTLMCYPEDPAVNPNAVLTDMTENVLDVVVTVNERWDISFRYDVKNAPAGIDLSEIISIEPATVTLEGEKELLEMYADQLSQLLTVDFDTLSIKEKSRVIPIALPEGITLVGSGEQELQVKVNFDWTGYRERTFTWDLGEDIASSPIQFVNLPADKTAQLITKELKVTLCGKREAINALKVEDLMALVDTSNSSLGTYSVRPTVLSEDVWVYYGTTGYTVYLSIT